MRKPMILAVAPLFGALLSGALLSVAGAAHAETLRQQIERLETNWLDAYQRGDGKAAAALVTPDVAVINSDGKSVDGGAAYAAAIDRYAAVAKLSVQVDAVEPIGNAGAMATGNYVAHVDTGANRWLVQGYWLRLYVRDGDDWKIRASAFSEKQPSTDVVTVR